VPIGCWMCARQAEEPLLHIGKSRPGNISDIMITQMRKDLELTEMRSAVPVQSPSPPASRKEKRLYETSAPKGVDALKNAMCFLHSDRGSAVDSREVVNANAVGALPEIM
jgi:hypothetical protein